MNKSAFDILQIILDTPSATQRQLAVKSGYSLGKINNCIVTLKENGYLDKEGKVTNKSMNELQEKRPRNAIILAAGYGLRMIPLNIDTPKGLLKIKGETLVERLIRQLREVGVQEIHLVVGHLREAYEFLLDDEDINLIVNRDYTSKNNLHSLYSALPHLGNSYIVPCDLRFEENPFSEQETYSWYGLTDKPFYKSTAYINSKGELRHTDQHKGQHTMIGISYLLNQDMTWFKPKLTKLAHDSKYDQHFWEEVLKDKNKFKVWAKVFPKETVFEFNSLEDLQYWQDSEDDFNNPALKLITSKLNIQPSQIRSIRPMESGMTNRSFTFESRGNKYIMRVPGEGTEKLINRRQELKVHKALKRAGLANELVYFDESSGYKLSKKLPDARVCNPLDQRDVKGCMALLRDFHKLKLHVEHEFDVYAQLEYYENLWGGVRSMYPDYSTTKERIYELKEYIEDHIEGWTLCHIDSVPDNFLFYKEEGEEEESIVMIDWEYSAMQDPHIDLAMFAIYTNYSQEQIDQVIDFYFDGECPDAIRIKIYAYVALCGLLWSNWCEYKRLLGVDFGQYSLYQYRYAKVYYKKVIESTAYQSWLSTKEGNL